MSTISSSISEYHNTLVFVIPIVLVSLISLFSLSYAQVNDLENLSASNVTSNWTTYSSDAYGIGFDHPSSWEVSEKENRFDSGADVSVTDYETDAYFSASKTIDRSEDNPLKPSALAASTRMIEDGAAQSEENTIIEPTDVKKYTVGGERAGSFLTKHDDGSSTPIGMETFIVFHKGDAYMLNFRTPTEIFDNPETQDTKNRIIESFKFLD